MNNARYMRATVAAWLVAVSALAADPLVVEFSLVNLGVQPATNRSVIITPIILEPGPGQVAVYDRVLRNTGLSGKFYLTNLMVGMYRVTVQTPPDTTTYAIAVTTNDVGRVSADKMLVAMPTAVVRPQDYPYSAQASDRRYAPASVSTTATGWKLVEPEYAGGTNTFAPVYQLTQGNGIVVNPVTTAVGSGLYTVKTQWMELDREIVVWTNAAGDLITRSPHDEVDDIYVFTSQAGATNFDATTGWPGWGIGWQGLTNSGVLAAKWSWTTNYVLQGWGLNGQVPEDGAVLAWGAGLDYTTNGGVWTVYATNIPARSLGTSNAPSAGKVLTVDSNTNLYWTDLGSASSVNLSNIVWESLEVDANLASIYNLDILNVGLVECASIVADNYIKLASDVRISGLVFATNGIVLGAGATVTGDGSGLTNLPADQLTGTVPLARLGTNTPTAGQVLASDATNLYWTTAGTGSGQSAVNTNWVYYPMTDGQTDAGTHFTLSGLASEAGGWFKYANNLLAARLPGTAFKAVFWNIPQSQMMAGTNVTLEAQFCTSNSFPFSVMARIVTLDFDTHTVDQGFFGGITNVTPEGTNFWWFKTNFTIQSTNCLGTLVVGNRTEHTNVAYLTMVRMKITP